MIKHTFVAISILILLVSCSTREQGSANDSTIKKDNTQPKETTPPDALTPEEKVKIEEIKKLIEQLGALSSEERDKAQKRLTLMGKTALPYVRNAKKHHDPQVRELAKIIDKEITLRLRKKGLNFEISIDKKIYNRNEKKVTVNFELINKGSEPIVVFTSDIYSFMCNIVNNGGTGRDCSNPTLPITEGMFKILEKGDKAIVAQIDVDIIINPKVAGCINKIGKSRIYGELEFRKIDLPGKDFASWKAMEFWDELFDFNLKSMPIEIEVK